MENLSKILNNSESRFEFLFNLDEDSLTTADKIILQKFIKKSFASHRNLEDSFELSSIINYVDSNACSLAKSLMNKQVSYTLKLTILDFVLNNKNYIPRTCYLAVSELGIKSSNSLVKMQAIINLIYIGKRSINELVNNKILDNVPAYFFYRLLNNIGFISSSLDDICGTKARLIDFISSSDFISELQKDELIKDVKNI